MRAIVLERRGGPEGLVERDVDLPEPGPDEVRIRVAASGINFADILQRLGLYGSGPKPPYVPGFEVAGEISALGEDIQKDQEGAGGERVDGLAVGRRVVALTRFGGYAEEVCTRRSLVWPLPDSLTYQDGAALPVNYLTAWLCLHDMANLQPGERVLIQGGAGGVGTAAVQMALDAGATVFATAGSDDKVEFLGELGVHHPINYRAQRFDDEVRRIAGERELDVVLDAVGGETLQRGYRLLAPFGRLVSYGLSQAVSGERRNLLRALWAWWRTPSFGPLQLIGDNIGVFGFHLAHVQGREERVARAFGQILDRVTRGVLRPVIAETFPLTGAGVADAHRYIHARRNIGKVLLVTGMAAETVDGTGSGPQPGISP